MKYWKIFFLLNSEKKRTDQWPEGGMMSDSRLFKILYYLLHKKRATAPELAAEFEVSPRTIYRDVEALSSAEK